MPKHNHTRRLPGGREIDVGRNHGLRKVCGCPRSRWPKCRHSWHFAFVWRGVPHRFSLDRYIGKHVQFKTDAERLADEIRAQIRAGTFGQTMAPAPPPASSPGLTFGALGSAFIETYTKARDKVSWDDDECMVRQIAAFRVGGEALGDKPANAVTETDLETFIRHLSQAGRTVATRNHFVRVIKSLSAWSVRRGHRSAPLLTGESDIIRRKKATKRNRRLEPGEEDHLVRVAGPHLQRVIIAALESCCRLGELLSLQWRDVSLARNEIVIRGEKCKTRTDRVVPISTRLRAVLELVRHDPAGQLHPPHAYVFGNEVGERVKCIRRAWETAVLKAHGHTPTWTWTKGKAKKGTGKLSADSRATLRSIDLNFHDLRHEAGSRLLEAGWPLHEVQQMLGHANLAQTSTYLNATLGGLHRSMRALDQARARTSSEPVEPETDSTTDTSCKIVANDPACALLSSCRTEDADDSKLLVN